MYLKTMNIISFCLFFTFTARLTEYIQTMKKAIQEQNETDLELALDDLKNLGLPTVKDEIQYGETELDVMRCRRGTVMCDFTVASCVNSYVKIIFN